MTVTVTANREAILPGQSVLATVTVFPPEQADVDYVKITTRGVLVSSESLDVHLAGTFTATRLYTVPLAAGTGTLIVQATVPEAKLAAVVSSVVMNAPGANWY